ncbi:MAG: NAD-dependent malic enzyme [Deltaproteobacteria bacterium]|nr:NAD-dependent malic enzyme [Deltaproteobacteria bacterium]
MPEPIKEDAGLNDDSAYARQVLESCRVLCDDPNQAVRLTDRWNKAAVVTDGSNVPGLGDVGALASLPLVEQKSRVMRRLADITAFPLVLNSKNVDDAVRTIASIAPSFGVVNLEAMTEAASLEIKRRLNEIEELPIFHDVQDGLPILCLAAILNALKVVGKKMANIKLVIAGTETEGLPVVDFFRLAGAADIVVCDRTGAIHRGRPGATNWIKEELAQKTNPRQVKGSLTKALTGADALILLSAGNPPGKDILASMAPEPIVLNLSECRNIDFGPAAVLADKNEDGPNRLNSCLVFPGLLRGVLNARAREINANMKMTAALTLANMVPEAELGRDFIVPKVTKTNLVAALADAVSVAAAASGASLFI